MTHSEKITLYLSKCVDSKAMRHFENELYNNDDLFEQFIVSCEQDTRIAPPGFSESIMRKIEAAAAPATRIVPVLSRKLCAAACFSAAATITFFTITGYERFAFDFLSSQSGKLIDLVNTLILK